MRLYVRFANLEYKHPKRRLSETKRCSETGIFETGTRQSCVEFLFFQKELCAYIPQDVCTGVNGLQYRALIKQSLEHS